MPPLIGHADSLQGQPSFWSQLGEGLRSFATSMLPFGSLIDSGIGLISGLSNNAYSRNLQQQLFERDDTTLDRTMAMYERNGINPLLSLPNATATNTKGFEPGLLESNFAQAESLSLQNELQEANIAFMDAQKENLEEQLGLLKKDSQNKDIENALNQARLNWAKFYGKTRGNGDPMIPAYHESEVEQLLSAFLNNKDKLKSALPSSNSSEESKSPYTHASEKQKEELTELSRKEAYKGVLGVIEKHTTKDLGLKVFDSSGRVDYFQWRENKKSGVIEVQFRPGDWVSFKNDNELYKYLFDNGYHL